MGFRSPVLVWGVQGLDGAAVSDALNPRPCTLIPNPETLHLHPSTHKNETCHGSAAVVGEARTGILLHSRLASDTVVLRKVRRTREKSRQTGALLPRLLLQTDPNRFSTRTETNPCMLCTSIAVPRNALRRDITTPFLEPLPCACQLLAKNCLGFPQILEN